MALFQLPDALHDGNRNTWLAYEWVDLPRQSPCNFSGRIAPYLTSPAPLLRIDMPAIYTCPF